MSEKLSVSAAARRAGVSRQRLYQLIRAGRLPVEREAGTPRIDKAALAALFDLAAESREVEADRTSPTAAPEPQVAPLQVQLSVALGLLADRDQQLRDAHEREAWMRAHVDLIRREAETRLSEAQSRQQEIVARGKTIIAKYRAALEASNQQLTREPGRGFWARLFGR